MMCLLRLMFLLVTGAAAFSISLQQSGRGAVAFRSRALYASIQDEKVTTKPKIRADESGDDSSFAADADGFMSSRAEEILPSLSVSSNDSDLVVELKKEENEESLVEGFAWRGVVVVLCALWASNFAAAKLVMAEPGVDSALYAVTRFSVAALALLPGAIAAVRRGAIDVETAKGAAVCGSWVAFGYLGQTLGLLTTTASRSCVICSLHCVFVAAVAEYVRVSRKLNASFDLKRLIPAAVAVAGVAIVELQGAAGGPTVGDALSFAQPIGFGLGYLQLEELMRKRPEAALPVSAIKLLVVALASFGFFELSPIINNGVSDGIQMLWPPRVPEVGAIFSSPVALGGILYTGLITTALALWVESIAFKRVPATDASIILTTEPLFAAGAGALTLGETFGMSDYFGASLIIGACILAVLIQDESEDESCDPFSPEDCVPSRSWPFTE